MYFLYHSEVYVRYFIEFSLYNEHFVRLVCGRHHYDRISNIYIQFIVSFYKKNEKNNFCSVIYISKFLF